MERIALLLALFVAGCASVGKDDRGIEKIDHVVVLFQENWSFDGLLGNFPGANGLANAGAAATQVDKAGNAYATLPPSIGTDGKPDPRIPANLPNGPFDLARYVPPDSKAGNPIHQFYQNQLQIDGGKNDRFVAWTNVGGLVMSYYDASGYPLGKLAKQYTLADNFFMRRFRRLVPQPLLAGVRVHARVEGRAARDPRRAGRQRQPREGRPGHAGRLRRQHQLLGERAASDQGRRRQAPHAQPDAAHHRRPALGEGRHVGVVLAAAGTTRSRVIRTPLFQFHHQPFVYFKSTTPTVRRRKTEHLQDEDDFWKAIREGNLPAVAFVKPIGP